MIPIQFTEDQYDMVREVVNQAMGQAQLLKSFENLAVPDIEIVGVEHVVDKILEQSVFKETETVTLFRQTYVCITDMTEAAAAHRELAEIRDINQTLEEMTNHDSLTALYNKAYIEKQASLGVVEFRPEMKTHLQMIHEADIALYHSKTGGRNTVNCYRNGRSEPAVPAK